MKTTSKCFFEECRNRIKNENLFTRIKETLQSCDVTGWLSQIFFLEVSSFYRQMVCCYDQEIWSQGNYPVVKMPLGRTRLLPPSCILFFTFASYWCGSCKQLWETTIPCKGKEAVPATFKGNAKNVLFHISIPNCEHSDRGGWIDGSRKGTSNHLLPCIYFKVLLQVGYFPPSPFSSHTISDF